MPSDETAAPPTVNPKSRRKTSFGERLIESAWVTVTKDNKPNKGDADDNQTQDDGADDNYWFFHSEKDYDLNSHLLQRLCEACFDVNGILFDRATRGLNRDHAVRRAHPRGDRRDRCGRGRRKWQSRPVDTIIRQIQACFNERQGHKIVRKPLTGVFTAPNNCGFPMGQRRNFDNQRLIPLDAGEKRDLQRVIFNAQAQLAWLFPRGRWKTARSNPFLAVEHKPGRVNRSRIPARGVAALAPGKLRRGKPVPPTQVVPIVNVKGHRNKLAPKPGFVPKRFESRLGARATAASLGREEFEKSDLNIRTLDGHHMFRRKRARIYRRHSNQKKG